MTGIWKRLLLAAFSVFAGCIVTACSNEPERADVLQAIKQGLDYMHRGNVRGDEAFFLGQAALIAGDQFPGKLDLEASVQSGNAPEQKMYRLRKSPLFLPGKTMQLSVEQPEGYRNYNKMPSSVEVSLVADLMNFSINCRSAPVLLRARFMRIMAGNYTGYVLTHQLGALAIVFRQDCIERTTKLEHRYRELQQQLLIELLANPRLLTDLNIERAAILCFSGACQSVPAHFISRMVEGQNKNGSWADYQPLPTGGVLAPEHATALAIYTLSCWLYCEKPASSQ